ncbi:phosphoribosylanthranilate isomerase [Peribacillus cavernae]|uniref:N-(5'-phosphoribosyl)anthranilate isomerase n=1 Tax=Peribacillus cavernae TaxID=1674310 RepID=A0A433HPY2_9BACI|nr:phosphoribosylanthranilate isomerase [Peribacillus cavernae]MDQ0217227.1 phosphoribosylanthranilate isomerase [Peribacillus cavernae]RUQ30302.1 phosphoribosylanthranilate isomerase [Peribacillus cavernae]
MLVKICGIMNMEAAKAAVDAGADLIGFVFAESRRRVSPEQAAEIIESVRGRVRTVGVFVNEEIKEIKRAQSIAGLDYIQLHGNESGEFIKELSFPVIKALGIGAPEDIQQLASLETDYYLLDSPKGKYQGGNGVAIDSSLLKNNRLPAGTFILAGGLTPENVGWAIKSVKPDGVDVSSGVETNGSKDIDKIYRFVQNAKNISF